MAQSTKAVGGGSSAVAASAHAACARFRGTDPLITGVTRRTLAESVGFKDDFGGIPEARWMRAMTFERLVRDEKFASEVATTAVGRLRLDRPSAVVIANARVNVDRTAQLLQAAHQRAITDGAATMLHGLAVPFVGFEETRATDVKPDFAVVAPKVTPEGEQPDGSWLVMGDAKDYERVRSKIDDQRLLKGFLQVALGAESAQEWSQRPGGMDVHDHGVLAVPRNSFLQPEALVELLDDHRTEVRMRVAERRREAGDVQYDDAQPINDFVAHLEATFDPASCTSCTLFAYCRDELRTSGNPADLLIELGVPRDQRPHVVGMIDGTGAVGTAPETTQAMIAASLSGVPQPTGQRRVDQAGQPGTINVVLAKSDSAALGVYGIATQRVLADGPGAWKTVIFDDPQSAATRRSLMRILGQDLSAAMKDQRAVDGTAPSPVHLVVPDQSTADLLVSVADNLAGIELSRLRWERDKQQRRKPLTFNGEEAQVPQALPESDRTAVSFLLEEDRARTLTLRSPIVDARTALARHLVAGGPAVSSFRLDYLVRWALATDDARVDHRAVTDEIESSEHTPGARLTNRTSDAIHAAFTGARKGDARPADPATYDRLIRDELGYKIEVLEGAFAALDALPDSALREVHRAVEGDAQAVWRRRLRLHASDLVRFGRTYRHWRNSLVPTIEGDRTAQLQLLALANPHAALDAARDPGTRQLATARVMKTSPLTLDVRSRRIGTGSRIVLLHVGDVACVEGGGVDVVHQKGAFKFTGLSIGPLAEGAEGLVWSPALEPRLAVGDELVVADLAWYCDLKSNKQLNLARPRPDDVAAPKVDCDDHSYDDNPEGHTYCCRPHESAEADWSDTLAERRARGELNPQAWPPVVDADAFEVSAADAAAGDTAAEPADQVPDDVIWDDLDVPA